MKRIARILTFLATGTLALFAITWWFTPDRNASIFGVPLEGAALAYGRVKGAEDLLAATFLALALWRRQRSGLVAALIAGLLVPIGDFAALVSVGAASPSTLTIHVVFVAAMILAAATTHRDPELT